MDRAQRISKKGRKVQDTYDAHREDRVSDENLQTAIAKSDSQTVSDALGRGMTDETAYLAAHNTDSGWVTAENNPSKGNMLVVAESDYNTDSSAIRDSIDDLYAEHGDLIEEYDESRIMIDGDGMNTKVSVALYDEEGSFSQRAIEDIEDAYLINQETNEKVTYNSDEAAYASFDSSYLDDADFGTHISSERYNDDVIEDIANDETVMFEVSNYHENADDPNRPDKEPLKSGHSSTIKSSLVSLGDDLYMNIRAKDQLPAEVPRRDSQPDEEWVNKLVEYYNKNDDVGHKSRVIEADTDYTYRKYLDDVLDDFSNDVLDRLASHYNPQDPDSELTAEAIERDTSFSDDETNKLQNRLSLLEKYGDDGVQKIMLPKVGIGGSVQRRIIYGCGPYGYLKYRNSNGVLTEDYLGKY